MGKNRKAVTQPKQIPENRGKTEKNVDPEYAVGYKNPPRHTQFKAGQSGNSKGRPKKKATFAEVITKQLRKRVTVNVGGKSQRLTMLEAIGLKQLSKAVSGDHKSTELLLAVLKPTESDNGDHLQELIHQFRLQDATNEETETGATKPDQGERP